MDLSQKERLILFNQYEILEHLNPQEAETYKNFKKILCYGYKEHYNDLVEGFSSELSEDITEFVVDVLDMYSALLNSYQNLEDRTGIEERLIEFPGFDGNNETEELGYAKFFLHDLDRFDELHKKDRTKYNSHMRKSSKYRLMLEVWKAKENRYNLSKEEINEIIHA